MTLKPIVHEIRIQNQVIFLDPPIEYARAIWIRQLHDWLGEFIRSLNYTSRSARSSMPFLFDQVSFVGYAASKVRAMRLGSKCKEA